MRSSPRMPSRTGIIAFRYVFFAVVVTAVNLVSQWMGLLLYSGPYSLPAAMVIGTATGLATKYVLDKRWIFYDFSTGATVNMRKFSLYTLMGVLTTAIFWLTELIFDALSSGWRLRVVGAVIGLAIAYACKYQLDRRFVFEAASGSLPDGAAIH